MDPSYSFDSLAGVRPGVSTVSEAASRFGTAVVSASSDDGLCFDFGASGVRLFSNSAHCADADPLIDEVHLTPPWAAPLPCNVRIGQRKADALAVVRRTYRVTNEYEDAIYFRPTSQDDLLASVEFKDEDVIVGIELMYVAERPQVLGR